MATTGYVDFTAAVRAIGDRTDAAGVDVGDYSAEEDRLVQAVFTAGTLTPDAFVVAPSSGMTVEVGSSTKDDLYAVEGEVAGQGVYLCRLDAPPVAVALAASDPSLSRTDELYLVIADAAYDGGSVSLPRIAVRTGDPGGGPPGPDSNWKASVRLASVAVAAGASSVGSGDITDRRLPATLRSHASDGIVPIGAVMEYACPVLPAGVWMLAQGQELSRSTYDVLFARMGTVHGAGDGSTTFNLPDLRDRRTVGASASKALGTTGGSETRTLTTGNLPGHTHAIDHNHAGQTSGSAGSHTHSISHDHGSTVTDGAHDHYHQWGANDGLFESYFRRADNTSGGSTDAGGVLPTGSAHSHDVPAYSGSSGSAGSHTHNVDLPLHSGSSGSTGSGNAFNVEAPWAALHKIIRVA